MSKLKDQSFLPKNGTVDTLVVFLHGFGADGQDLIGLAPRFAKQLPTTAFHAPDGPEICEISPFGRQWFSLARYDGEYLRRQAATQDVAFEAMHPGAEEASKDLNEYIAALKERYGLENKDIALVGFSQGTMMALHVGLREHPAYAALIGFSGALVGASQLSQYIKNTVPTLLIHGEADEMLPVHAVDLASKALRDNDVPTEVIKRPNLPHAIDAQGANLAAQFIKERFHKK